MNNLGEGNKLMPESVTIKVRDRGPYLVSGPVKLVDSQGNEIDVGDCDDFVLCRCGQSANRPFCDGAHKQAEFEADRSGS
ncbi:CDGSH iron-sulfur domain-containing protein [Symmachiella macrocystis]|nr:CDGSH iron-sulfur domain-containing protein [Symmachiella macrocystis]